jgi:hypothetical protein
MECLSFFYGLGHFLFFCKIRLGRLSYLRRIWRQIFLRLRRFLSCAKASLLISRRIWRPFFLSNRRGFLFFIFLLFGNILAPVLVFSIQGGKKKVRMLQCFCQHRWCTKKATATERKPYTWPLDSFIVMAFFSKKKTSKRKRLGTDLLAEDLLAEDTRVHSQQTGGGTNVCSRLCVRNAFGSADAAPKGASRQWMV